MEYYSVVKRYELLIYAKMSMNFKIILLKEAI